MENTDFVIENIDKEVQVIADNPSQVDYVPTNTDFFIENIDANVISIAHSLNIEASEVTFRPANTDFFIENIDNNVKEIAESLELTPSEVTVSPANTDFFIENIDANLIAIAEKLNLTPYEVTEQKPNTDFFIINIDKNVTLIKGSTNVITVSGNFININLPDGGKVLNYSILGNATQDGTPTPDSPVAINTVTGEQVVKIEGKNLLNIATGTLTDSGVEYSRGNGTISATGTSVRASYAQAVNLIGSMVSQGNYPNYATITTHNSLALPSGTYTLSATIANTGDTDGGLYIGVGDVGSRPASGDKLSATGSKSVTLAEGQRLYLDIWYEGTSTNKNVNLTISNIQLELGSTATTYESYQGQEFEIDLDSIELAKIGTYQDRIYKDEGKWYIEKQTGKVVLDENTAFVSYPYDTNSYATAVSGMANTPTSTQIVMSDRLYGVAYDGRTQAIQNMVYSDGGQAGQLDIRNTTWASLSDFTTWLATRPITVYYALATPTTTEITDETLLEQLNFVADMYEGINNISFIGTGAQGTIDIVINKN